MERMEIYNKVRNVPTEAQKTITGGRLNGMTDINPMWRLKTLTETFGPAGIGWKYTITEKRLETGAKGETAAFVDINLYYKHNGEWSEAIPGTGGSMFVVDERNGPRTSDECFKMALTDAISVACKALGFGADVYWDKDKTKYTMDDHTSDPKPGTDPKPEQPEKKLSEAQVKRAFAIASSKGYTADEVKRWAIQKYNATAIESLTRQQYDEFCIGMEGMQPKNKAG